LEAVTKDRARVIPGVLVNLVMTMIAFLPMFIKRLVYNAQAKRQAAKPGIQEAKNPRSLEV
jgi:hypothetical protein